MHNDSYIQILEEEKLMQKQENLFQEKQIYRKCNLCFSRLQVESRLYKTIERNFTLCKRCSKSTPYQWWGNIITVNNATYSKEIIITSPTNFQHYNIKRGLCKICYRYQYILIKLNQCNHYCCKKCLRNYVQYNFKSSKKLLCTQQGCEFEINDYLIIQHLTEGQISIWNKFIYTQFCYSRNCTAKFTLLPYNNLEQNNVYELNNKICCKSCKKQFCNICWTYHKGLCNFEKLFLQYKKKNNIINCPFCNTLGIPDCRNKGWNYPAAYLECYFCKMQFCEKCKCQKQLFDQKDIEQINKCHFCKIQTEEYNSFHDYYKKTMILSILLFPFYIIYLCAQCGIGFQLLQIYQVTKWVWEKTINKLLQQHTGLIFVISPFLTVVMLIAVLLIHIISFIPLLAINIKKFIIDR